MTYGACGADLSVRLFTKLGNVFPDVGVKDEFPGVPTDLVKREVCQGGILILQKEEFGPLPEGGIAQSFCCSRVSGCPLREDGLHVFDRQAGECYGPCVADEVRIVCGFGMDDCVGAADEGLPGYVEELVVEVFTL
ncbi:hypothetical protein ACWC1D_00130 [Streptomyces sp. NPDC001478]